MASRPRERFRFFRKPDPPVIYSEPDRLGVFDFFVGTALAVNVVLNILLILRIASS